MLPFPIKVPLATAKDHPLCINCKYYIPPPPAQAANKKRGLCQKSGTINVIDGEIEYTLVTIAREYDCHGDWFEPNDETLVNPPYTDTSSRQ